VRVFVAGATGVIGLRVVPLLVAAGHTVAAMTRSAARVAQLERLGAEAVVCDAYEAEGLRAAVAAFEPDLVMSQLTDLPDDPAQVAGAAAANDRMRSEGTRNVVAAAAGRRLAVQSIAWEVAEDRRATIAAHEGAVLDAGGVVLRYGQLYGPDTYCPDTPPDPPRVHIDEAARRTAAALEAPPGIVTIVE
jgi:NAD(P)H-binding